MSAIKKFPRWESSRKSLFVKTVWVQGQRHVILFDEDPITDCPRFTARSSRSASSTGKNSHRQVLSPTASQDFRVASVKLLLSEVSSFKKESRRLLNRITPRDIANTLSVHVIPNDKVTYKNIDDDVMLTNDKQWENVNLLKAFKSATNSFDTDCRGNVNENEYYERNYYICNENRFNTLSDRVLSWLDLAVQNECAGITDKLRADYREMLNQKNENLLKHKYLRNNDVFNRSKSCDYQDVLAQQWSKRQIHFLKTTNILSFSSTEINSIENVQPTTDETVDLLQITSYRETSPISTKVPIGKRRTEILRRQLHIFIPNIRKRSDDTSSISSKSSSLVKSSSL